MSARPPEAESGGRDGDGTHVAEIGQAVHVGLVGLQQRIDELQRSVETLAVEGRWVEPGADLTYEAGYEQPFVPPYETHYDGTWAEPFQPVPEARGWVPPPRPEPAYPPPADLLAPAPAEWEQPFDPPAPPYRWEQPAPMAPPPPPLRQAQASAPAPWLTITLLDAGPFADLIELRHFEEALSALPPVHDVLVRRFGHGRARIEVGIDGMHSLAAELGRTGQPMEIRDGPGGELLVELPPPADPEPPEPADPPVTPATTPPEPA